jgi:DNA-3-methyladenine glycosylase
VVAPDLLGRYLVRRLAGQRLVARIVETEAYLGASDRASHAWGGRRTPRNEALFRDGGLAYVYFIYGMYHCLNAVTGRAANGDAVLIRAAEPIVGEDLMARHRGLSRRPRPGDLTGGPGKLCQALAIDRQQNGQSLKTGSLVIAQGEPIRTQLVVSGPRIGIDYAGDAVDWPLRFAEGGNRHVSRPYPWSRRAPRPIQRSSM